MPGAHALENRHEMPTVTGLWSLHRGIITAVIGGKGGRAARTTSRAREREREAEGGAQRGRIMHLCITMMSSGTFARKETSLIAGERKKNSSRLAFRDPRLLVTPCYLPPPHGDAASA